MITKQFVTAGKAIFTVELPPNFAAISDNPPKPHYTYKVSLKKGDPNGQWKNDSWFVNLLAGPDNTNDYVYLGKLIPDSGEVRHTDKSKIGKDSWPFRIIQRVLARLWANDGPAIEAAGWDVHHVGKCCRCGRALTVPESIESGIGPECATKI